MRQRVGSRSVWLCIGVASYRAEHVGEHPSDFGLRGAVTRVLGHEVEQLAPRGKIHDHKNVTLLSGKVKDENDAESGAAEELSNWGTTAQGE